MGDLIGSAVESNLAYVGPEAFARVRALNIPVHDRVALFADLARINALYMIARAGSGHIGSSFSSLDIVAWLHLQEMRAEDGDLYFSSKGHDAPGLYAVLTGMGRQRFELIHRFRRLGGLPGHPDRRTEGIATNTGSLGMGVSKAKGFAEALARAGRGRARVFVMLGDGELQEGQVWESLASAANRGQGSICAIVDHNKLQSDTFVSQTADLGDIEAKFSAFGWRVARIDGHDLTAIEAALRGFDADHARPMAIVADTVKGRGVSFMEHTALEGEAPLYRFHSGAPSAADYLAGLDEIVTRANRRLAAAGAPALDLHIEPRPAAAKAAADHPVERLVPAWSAALVAAAQRDPTIVALDADLALDTGLLPFREAFPDRFVECGIAEMDMVSQAGAMALGGLTPVCHSFACFLSTRANEQIYNNCSEATKVIYLGALAGLIPAAPGHSHQSVRDIAAVGSCPNLVMVEPASAADIDILMPMMVDPATPAWFMRLCSVPWPRPYAARPPARLGIGQGYRLREGRDGVLFAYGPLMCAQAVVAADLVAGTSGRQVAVINLPFLNRIDEGWLAGEIMDVPALYTLDNHYLRGGQGEMVLSAALRLGWRGRTATSLGLTELPVGGAAEEVLAHHGLDAAAIARRLAEDWPVTSR